MQIKGTFDVKLEPLDFSHESQNGMKLGRMSIEKTFYGELSGSSKGEMLSALTDREGSAGYVAIEQLSGTLNEKEGSFVLQHFGLMSRGKDRLILEVVPDSGTGELEGLSGKMQIVREDGKHYYIFDYLLED